MTRPRPLVVALGVTTGVLLGSLALGEGTTTAAHASPAGAFAADTNALRSSHGLAGYRTCADLTALAQRWANHMAATHTLAHNPNLTTDVADWQRVGENVGDGPDEPAIQNAFVHSPKHYANLTSPDFLEAGYATAESSDGQLWVDAVFRRPTGSGCGPAVATSAIPPRTAVRSAPPPAVVVVPSRSRPAPTATPPARRLDRSATTPSSISGAAPTTAARLAAAAAAGAPDRDVVGAALAFARTMTLS